MHKKIKIDNSCYFIIIFFQETGSSYSINAGMLLACCAEFACVCCRDDRIVDFYYPILSCFS